MMKVEKYEFDENLYYDRKDHLWARVEEASSRTVRVRVGLDMFGQHAAGTIVYLKILPVGRKARKGRAFGSLEAGKYVGPLKAPVSGTLIEVNAEVLATPKLVNDDCYGDGWFVVIEPTNLQQDLKDLAHGEEEIRAWIEADLKEYREKGLLGEEED